MGINAMDEDQYNNLKEYVKSGGTLVIALGQLRKEEEGKIEGKNPRSLLRSDFTDFLGVKIPLIKGQPIHIQRGDPVTFETSGEPIKFLINNIWEDGYVYTWYRIKPYDCKVICKTEAGEPIVTYRKFGKGEIQCRRCKTHRGVIRKYGLYYCRKCMREIAKDLGFRKYT